MAKDQKTDESVVPSGAPAIPGTPTKVKKSTPAFTRSTSAEVEPEDVETDDVDTTPAVETDDSGIDRAIDEITRQESDEVLANQDEFINSAYEESNTNLVKRRAAIGWFIVFIIVVLVALVIFAYHRTILSDL